MHDYMKNYRVFEKLGSNALALPFDEAKAIIFDSFYKKNRGKLNE